MSDFLPSTGWFMLTAFMCFATFVLFVTTGESISRNRYPHGTWFKNAGGLIVSTIGCFMLAIVCLICGFRAPEKIEHINVRFNMSDIPTSVIERTLKESFKQMPNSMKYKILTDTMDKDFWQKSTQLGGK